MFPLMPETYLWLDNARKAETQAQADSDRHAAEARGSAVPEPAAVRPPAAVEITEARREMADDLRRFLRGLSATTTYRRFLTPVVSLSLDQTRQLLRADDGSRALVALRDEVIVGHAMAVGIPDSGTVDLGVVVADRWQQQGIGRRLIGALLTSCPAAGARGWDLEVAVSNSPVRRVIQRNWPGAAASFDGTVIRYQVIVHAEAPALEAMACI